MPKEFRYTEEHPYISKGLGRNYKKGQAYVGVEADVAEFEDLFLSKAYNVGINMSGLGIDEYCDACIQFARKNYADLMPDGSTKKVGNTIKSRKMAGYLESFIDDGVNLLLHGDGSKFIENYYNYIDDIYNYRIPILDIASKGKIKKTIEEYKKDCQTLTKAGNKKSRQAWYELAIKYNLNLNVGDTVYYINIGEKKSHTDVKKITDQYVYDDNKNIVKLDSKLSRKLLEKECEKNNLVYKDLKQKDKKALLKKYIVREEDIIVLNCEMVPNEIVNSEEKVLCSEYPNLKYNVEKYISQFNKRVSPLLVCFHPDIRDKILITNPKDRMYFTEEETKLVSGYPRNEVDQDTYEALMTPERKEIEFWKKIGEKPPFIEECGIDWDDLLVKYDEMIEKEKDELFKELDKQYIEIISSLTKEEVEAFEEEYLVPDRLINIVHLNKDDLCFRFNQMPEMKPSTGGFVFDDIKYTEDENDEDE